ncbi:MAG TPA: hypothetical protein VH682_25895 [Gemmataceae bacterium]|jgi:hypothetical protein
MTPQFGLLSVLAAVGFVLAKLTTDDLSNFTFSILRVVLGVGAAISIGLAAGLLYVAFNKK